MVQIKVRITQRMDEIARTQSALLRDHHRQQRVRSDVERYAQKRFRLNTRSFLPSVGTITVRIATAGQTVAEIGYTVVPKCNEGCRIAWRSRAGSIEHYTFPVVKSVVQKIRKEQVLTDDAGYEDISIRDERTTTLASAFEPAAVIEALAEIAASPQVWKIDGDKYEEVDILTREQTIGRHGSLGCIEISLRPRQETRCL